jgi:hypothetical protein
LRLTIKPMRPRWSFSRPQTTSLNQLSTTQNSDSPAESSQKIPSECTTKNPGTNFGPITSFGQSPDAKKASPPPEQGLSESAAQEETIKDDNNNSMVPIAKEKPSEDKTAKGKDSTLAAFFRKEYNDNGKRWHFVARGEQAVLKPDFFDGDDLPAETETDRGKGVFVYRDDNNEDTEESSEDGEDVDTENGSVIGDDEKHDEEGEEIEVVEDERGETEENVVGEEENVVVEQESAFEQDEKAGGDNVGEGAHSTGSCAVIVDKAAAKVGPAGEPAKLTAEALEQVETEEKPYDTNRYKYLQTVPTEGTVAPQDEEDEDWEHMSDEDAENDANTNRPPRSMISQFLGV